MDTTTKNWRKILDGFAGDLDEIVTEEIEEFLQEKKRKKKKKKKKAGKRDACYHKVKSRYAVWPSAYASGALVKCRKVGAKNWGNKSKKTNEDTAPGNEKKNFKERKLSKPEYKKKKEIAAAIKRDNPDMPDEKRYAISTATAKKVAERCQKGYKTHPTRKTKKMFGRTYRNCVKAEEGKDPKKGTGKKPKGSSRRLYTDENPKDTVSVKFSSVSDIRDTFSKASFKSKSHKRQSQIINLVHQRVRAAYKRAKDPKVKARLKKAYNYAKKRKEASKKKTQRMRKKK